jgi:superfamily II DNA or RNA helicase
MVSHEKFTLDLLSLQKQLGQATYDRAREVYVMQKIPDDYSATQSSATDWQLVANARGSGSESYAVAIDVEMTAWGEISSWRSECACPVGQRCKHAGALMLKAAYRSKGVVMQSRSKAAVDDGAPKPAFPKLPPHQSISFTPKTTELARNERDVQNWLDLFAEDVSSESIQIATVDDDALQSDARSGQDKLVFFVSVRKQKLQEQLYLSYGQARELVRGGWGKVRDVNHVDMNALSPTETQIVKIIQAMGRSGSYYGYSLITQAAIEGDMGQLALRLAQSSGKLFWSGDGKSLGTSMHLGAPRDVSWYWRESKAQDQSDILWQLDAQLSAQVGAPFIATPSDDSAASNDAAAIYQNNPALYLDVAAQEIGLISSPGMNTTRLRTLLQSPPIAQKAWLHHEQALLRHLAGLPMPPFAKPPREIKSIEPTWHVSVSLVSDDQQARFGLMMLNLEFDYAGVRHFSHRMGNPVLVDAADATERILLHRDLEAEKRAIGFLQAQQLQGSVKGQFYLPQQSAESQLPWVRWVDEAFDTFQQAGFTIKMPEELLNWVQRADAVHFKMQGKNEVAAVVVSANATDDSPIINEASIEANGTSPWFDLSLGIEVQGQRINILPALPALIAQIKLLKSQLLEGAELQLPETMYVPHHGNDGGAWLRLPTEPLKPWLSALLELLDGSHNLKGESLRLSRMEALRLSAALGEGAVWDGAQGLKKLLTQLKGGASALQPVLLPEGLKAELRPYQLQGLSWLQFLREQGLAGVLADDMGLGKTLQTLAHLLIEKEAGRLTHPALIIAPVSLMGNWQREAAKFTPSLRVLLLHGAARHEAAQDISQADIVLSPYSLLPRDKERWLAQQWSIVVLDEAQNIKNAHTDAAQVAYEIPAGQRLCLSGTPMENHLGELWSLFHFLMPGFLGSARRFKELYRTPIEKHGDSEILAALSRRVTPFILRRTKKEVLKDLPDKIETLSMVSLEGQQADLYETIRLATEKSVREALSNQGLARSQIQVLDALLKLRQVCCDPRLVPTEAARAVKQSAKLELLMEILPEMLAEGRKVLLFSQFTSMLELIEEELAKRKIQWVKLTGQSKKRDDIIDQFTSGQVPLFLISLKAGGVGLNLPQADTVIHYDPWWNPAVENQATDRAHRIGQTSQVFVYKLVASGTIEERMLKLQERKAQLTNSMLDGAQMRKQPLFTEDDVAQLLKPLGD